MAMNRRKPEEKALPGEGFVDQTLAWWAAHGTQERQDWCCPDTISDSKFKIKIMPGSERSSDFN